MRSQRRDGKRKEPSEQHGSCRRKQRKKDNDERNSAKLAVVASLVRHCFGTSGLPNM